jgi:hypothetical protein
MTAMLRRLRSALIVGIVWGAIWLPVGVALVVSKGGLRRFPFDWRVWAALGNWTVFATLSGAGFALLLAARERTRTVETLAPRRVLGWGLLAGAAVPTGLSAVLLRLFPSLHLPRDASTIFAWMAALGAASALLTIAVARHRRAPAELNAPPT